MLHFISEKHALKKAAKNVLQGAERVKLYRGDLLSTADIDLIKAYAELLWSKHIEVDTSILKNEILIDLPHLIVLTNEWQQFNTGTEQYIKYILYFFEFIFMDRFIPLWVIIISIIFYEI